MDHVVFPFMRLTFRCLGILLVAACTTAHYPEHWWTPVPEAGRPDWEILPQAAHRGEVILSKRNELGLLSNFAPTPFTYHGVRYASLEGFWQMMLYPEDDADPRAHHPGITWPHTRAEVSQMTGFQAKEAGTIAENNMRAMGIDWVSFEGKRFAYRSPTPGEHYALIAEATREKVRQNDTVRTLLLATGDLVLRPDHIEEPDAPPEWHYYTLLSELRAELRHSQQLQCPEIDTTSAWVRANKAWSSELGLHWSNDSLRQVLLALVEQDQAARASFGSKMSDSVYVRELNHLDSTLAARMDTVLDRFGLPTRAQVGPSGSDAAMLVIQHNWPLQQRALALARSLPRGQISPEKVAMLEDRILVHQGKPQRYGTQFAIGADGLLRFSPASDTRGLAARRARAGMPPMDLYVCLLEESGMHIDRGSLPVVRP